MAGRNRNIAHSASAFTLIELLVVIAIIAILASLLFPAISRGRMLGERAACISNLRQQSLALQMYHSDYGAYPLGVTRVPGDSQQWLKTWIDDVGEYCQTKWSDTLFQDRQNAPGIFSCKGFVRVGGRSWRKYPGEPSYWPGSSYGYNFNGVSPYSADGFGLGGRADSVNGADLNPRRPSEVAAPSEMISLGDSVIATIGGEKSPLSGSIDLSASVFNNAIVIEVLHPGEFGSIPDSFPWWRDDIKRNVSRHGGKTVVTYCDGHVSFGTWKTLFDPRIASIARQWNIERSISEQPARPFLFQNQSLKIFLLVIRGLALHCFASSRPFWKYLSQCSFAKTIRS